MRGRPFALVVAAAVFAVAFVILGTQAFREGSVDPEHPFAINPIWTFAQLGAAFLFVLALAWLVRILLRSRN